MAIIGAFVTVPAPGQVPPSTKFLGHLIGETVDQWLTTSHMDQAEICGKHDRRDKRMDFKQVCAVLSAVRSGQSGNITTADNVQWFFEHGKVSQALKLVSIGIDTTTEQQIAFLTEVYGRPTQYDTVKNSNLAGGAWNTVDVGWDMPDGALINAKEVMSVSPQLGPSRTLFISASSKESLAASKPTPNPYK